MVVEAPVDDIVRTLRRAHEEGDADLALSLYAEHASPPRSPRVFSGRERITEYLHHLYGQDTSHHVGAALQDVVMGEGRLSFNVTRVDARGNKLLAAQSYEVRKGKVVFQTNVEVS